MHCLRYGMHQAFGALWRKDDEGQISEETLEELSAEKAK